MTGKPLQMRNLDPFRKAVSTKRSKLQDLKFLLGDRFGVRIKSKDKDNESIFGIKRNVFGKDKSRGNNRLYGVRKKTRNGFRKSVSDFGNRKVKLRRKLMKGRRCYTRIKTSIFMLMLVITGDLRLGTEAKSTEPRYETAYACEGKTLKIGCGENTMIHLIRANYGRFSITICNDHGNTDWSVNCMSAKSLRVLHGRCDHRQNCSIMATTAMFGDPCPNTLKYLEAHYQCTTATETSTTNRPSPPWLITSQPTVWRSTVLPVPKGPVQSQQSEKKKPTVITPPTFRPHITLPPEVKLGDVVVKMTTARLPETSSEIDPLMSPPEVLVGKEIMTITGGPGKDKDSKVIPAIDGPQWPITDLEVKPTIIPMKTDLPRFEDDLKKFYIPHIVVRRGYCQQIIYRGLNWNWTLIETYAVQPCPGGATGLAKWKCVSIVRKMTEEEHSRRRGINLQSGENYHDLGLEPPNERQQQLIKLGSEALLKGSDGESPEYMMEHRGGINIPDAQASSVYTGDHDFSDTSAVWQGEPDLSECRSVWLNSLETRVREGGESLLSISNDLAQVTSSKTLYGGDLMTTTNIIKKLKKAMKENLKSFLDLRQREAIAAEMLLGVVKTGSNLLDDSQRPAWTDLNKIDQYHVATSLLTELEANAFLLADTVPKEKNVLQIVKNICLSVRVLEVKNLKDETFPTPIAMEQWAVSTDTITIPKAALLENRQNELVRVVFFAFDHLEQILPPVLAKSPEMVALKLDPSRYSEIIEGNKDESSKILNSKVISASLGNGRHIQLTQSVKVILEHLRTDNVTNPICVFWDYTLLGWSPEGCRVEWTNDSHTECSCSHLTNFAVLMDLRGVELPPEHQMALRTLTFVGCAISAVALLAAIIIFQCFRNMKSERVLIHKNLCACLLLAELVFMFGIDQTQERILCGVIAGLLHYLFLAAFAWMFLEGFHLYAMLVEVFEPERPRYHWYCVSAYLAPALIVLISAAVYPAGYGTERHCWLTTDRMFVMSFVGPVALVLTANWICLSMVIYMMCRHSTVSIKAKENSKLYKIRVWMNSSLVLAFLLGLTWTFGLLYLNEQTVGIAYTFTILNSLQGLVIFIFHCLLNEVFQKECARLGRRHKWLACCLYFAAPPSQPSPNNAPTASSSNHVENRQGSVKSRRYQQSATAENDDVVDPRDVTSTASTSLSASTTNNLVINNLNVVVNNNNHNNNNVINNAAVASLAAAAAAHSYHSHRNRRNSPDSQQNFGPSTNFGPTLNATAANFPHNIPEREAAPMSHLRGPVNPGSGRYPQGYRPNLQQEYRHDDRF